MEHVSLYPLVDNDISVVLMLVISECKSKYSVIALHVFTL